jgi:hypothetical protein
MYSLNESVQCDTDVWKMYMHFSKEIMYIK